MKKDGRRVDPAKKRNCILCIRLAPDEAFAIGYLTGGRVSKAIHQALKDCPVDVSAIKLSDFRRDKKISVRINKAEREKAESIGDGNATLGIRLALLSAVADVPPF